jgi:hypothetical protein
MALICSCGAELPDNARFCHHCGKPQREEDLRPAAEGAPEPVAPVLAAKPEAGAGVHFGNPVALRVALLCGSLSALLNAIPFVSFGCCIWITGAGFLAAYLYARRAGVMLRVGEGARLGWMTGCLGFVVSIVFTAINFALVRASGFNFREILRQSMEKMPAQDPAARQVMEFLTSTPGLAVFIVVYVVVSFAVMSGLAAAGGALSAKVMEKE